jgi:hypothetical protein
VGYHPAPPSTAGRDRCLLLSCNRARTLLPVCRPGDIRVFHQTFLSLCTTAVSARSKFCPRLPQRCQSWIGLSRINRKHRPRTEVQELLLQIAVLVVVKISSLKSTYKLYSWLAVMCAGREERRFTKEYSNTTPRRKTRLGIFNGSRRLVAFSIFTISRPNPVFRFLWPSVDDLLERHRRLPLANAFPPQRVIVLASQRKRKRCLALAEAGSLKWATAS